MASISTSDEVAAEFRELKPQLSNRNGISAFMPTPFSEELRQAIVLAIDSGMSVTEAADKFHVARRTIYYYLQRARSQMKTPRAAGASSGPQSSLQNYRKTIIATRNANPDLSMRELCELLKLSVSPSTLSRTLAAWNLAAEHEMQDES